MSCPLCDGPGGALLWQDALCRVVLADEPDYPGFLRVILNSHVSEMTDLPENIGVSSTVIVPEGHRAARKK